MAAMLRAVVDDGETIRRQGISHTRFDFLAHGA
jgi:hypothetical protein